MRKKEENQLCILFSKLGASVESSDEIGMLVGYSVLKALVYFETRSGSEEEIRFEEVKQVHRTIEETIKTCVDAEPFSALSVLMQEVEPRLTNVMETPPNKLNEIQSTLLQKFVSCMSFKGGYEDKLRRIGLRLFEDVVRKQPFIGTRNILNADYEVIDYYFERG